MRSFKTGLHSLTSNASPIASTWVPGCWWMKWAAVEGKTLTIHFCNRVTSLCKRHKRSHSRAMVCFWRNSVCTMWASSMGAITPSETVLAYRVTMSSNPWKKFLMASHVWWLSYCLTVLCPLCAQIPVAWPHQHVMSVLRYKFLVALFRVLRGYSFPGGYVEGLSTQ